MTHLAKQTQPVVITDISFTVSNKKSSRGRCLDGASCGCLRCCFNAAGNSSDGHIFLFMPEKLLFIMHA